MYNFRFYLPTKVYFGSNILKHLEEELPSFGKKCLFVYGKGSIIRSGLYDKLMEIFDKFKIEVIHHRGIKPNPLLSQVYEGIEKAREYKVEFVLACGGGSVIDAAKAISFGFFENGNLWDFFERKKYPEKALPLITIPTIFGTGSELDNVSVIVNDEKLLKLSIRADCLFPKLTLIDPSLTLTVPPDYAAYGIVDAFSHYLELYLHKSLTKPSITQDLQVVFMKNIIKWSKTLMTDFENLEARKNLFWCSSLALTDFPRAGIGKYLFIIHALEHSLSGKLDIPHGLGLAIMIRAYFEANKDNSRVSQFFKEVFEIKGKKRKEIVEKGIKTYVDWIENTLKLPSSLKELNVKEYQIEELAKTSYEIFEIWGASKYYSFEEVKKFFELAYESSF